MLSLLNRAADGNELLAVVDSFAAENAATDDQNSPTESTEFWYRCQIIISNM